MKVAATILALALSTRGHYAYAGDYFEKPNTELCGKTTALHKEMAVHSLEECESAATSLGYTVKKNYGSMSMGHVPYGCIILIRGFWVNGAIVSNYDSIMFNTNENGRPGYAQGKTVCKKAPPAPPCGCGDVTAAQDGCQCGKDARCKTGQRCVQGQCKTISSCKELKRIPMSRDRKAECINECRKTWCSGGCQSYNLYQGYCILSSCPYKG